jgi:hypothetical protein
LRRNIIGLNGKRTHLPPGARCADLHSCRPVAPPQSPTLGLGHLQFEALITTARLSNNPNDFALIAMLDDRVRKTLDRHPNYILAAYMASGT